MTSDTSDTENVYVLLRKVNYSDDGVELSVNKFVNVYRSEEEAQKFLDENIREPLHRQYMIEEWPLE